MKKIRTRFAPSPTGYLHLGGLRTALFSWLWARKHEGEFILRLEDTDQDRLIPDSIKAIIDDLQASGLAWDFGPDKPHPDFGVCIQSQRLKIYQEMIQILLEKKLAYYDYTSNEDLAKLRGEAQKEKRAFIFRQHMAQTKAKEKSDSPAIRIAIPDNLKITWTDVVKGEQSWQGKDIGDFIALKKDGWPTYHFASVVDDHLMSISHIIRGDEWLSSTPRHLYLFDCFNWEKPQYVHVPAILAGQTGKKLSKRDQGGRVSELWEKGYLKEALLNYLALLGWNPKNEQEIFSIKELIRAFDIHQIQVSGARFDLDRLNWFNGKHLRALNPKARQAQAQAWWPKDAQAKDEEYKNQVLEAVYERLKTWDELPNLTHFFFSDISPPSRETIVKESKLADNQIDEITAMTLKELAQASFRASDLEVNLYNLALENKLAPSRYFMFLRLKLTGQSVAPSLFTMMEILGKEICIKRLEARI